MFYTTCCNNEDNNKLKFNFTISTENTNKLTKVTVG